jgi:hypothetical protein
MPLTTGYTRTAPAIPATSRHLAGATADEGDLAW